MHIPVPFLPACVLSLRKNVHLSIHVLWTSKWKEALREPFIGGSVGEAGGLIILQDEEKDGVGAWQDQLQHIGDTICGNGWEYINPSFLLWISEQNGDKQETCRKEPLESKNLIGKTGRVEAFSLRLNCKSEQTKET